MDMGKLMDLNNHNYIKAHHDLSDDATKVGDVRKVIIKMMGSFSCSRIALDSVQPYYTHKGTFSNVTNF